MSEKYIDLGPQIAGATRKSLTSSCHLAQLEGLRWLDDQPDQVPGRTITESEFRELMEDVTTSYQVGFTDGLYRAGGRVVPDPKPTPQQRLEALIFEERGDRDDAQDITHAILKEFDVSVKAPGANDDQ